MRRTLAVLACSVAIVLQRPVRASDKPPEGYQKAEKDLDAANTSLRNDVKAIDYTALERDALAMRAAFGTMLEYWQAKKTQDAIKFVQDGIVGTVALETAAKAMNYNGVLAAQNAIAGSNGLAFTGEALPGVCVGCHLAHRQRLPDRTYEIK
jgi:hypothetical protein